MSMTSRVRVVVVQRARPAYNQLIIFIIASTISHSPPPSWPSPILVLVLYRLHLVTLYNAVGLVLHVDSVSGPINRMHLVLPDI
jgi:hypothetical protein